MKLINNYYLLINKMSELNVAEISKNIHILFSSQLKKVLTEISNEYSLDKNKLLTKYLGSVSS